MRRTALVSVGGASARASGAGLREFCAFATIFGCDLVYLRQIGAARRMLQHFNVLFMALPTVESGQK
jgi:hypothetical protein